MSNKKLLKLLSQLPDVAEQVAIVKAHIVTPEQAEMLEVLGITVEDIFAGKFAPKHEEGVATLVAAWNEALGEDHFSFAALKTVAEVNQIGAEVEEKHEAEAKDEKKQKVKKVQAVLGETIGKGEDASGKEIDVTKLDMMSHQVRQTVVQVLKDLDPEGYKAYREAKYAGGDNPDLDTRKAAYKLAFEKFLDATYTKPGV